MSTSTKQSGGRRLSLLGLGAALVMVLVVSGVAIVNVVRAPADEAAQALEQIAPTVEREQGAMPAIIQSARAYLDSERPERAQTVLVSAIKQYPSQQQLYFLLGEALLQQQQVARAYAAYDRGIMIGPDRAEYRDAAATLAAQIGRLDESEMHYLAAQKLAPGNPKYPLYLAQVQRKEGFIEEAKKNLLLATQLDPDLAVGWGTLAAIALDENKLSIAQQHIKRARDLAPADLAFRVLEAQVLRRRNQPSQAVTLLMALDPEQRLAHPGLLVELARSYGLLSQPGSAAQMYVEAAAAQPEVAEYAYQAAIWLERAGEPERALAYAQRAKAVGHDQAEALVDRLAGAE